MKPKPATACKCDMTPHESNCPANPHKPTTGERYGPFPKGDALRQPTTGEWTVERIAWFIQEYGIVWQIKIVEAINAELAAERDSTARLSEALSAAGHQLYAERKKPKTTEYAQGWDDHVLAARSQIEELREQLAAEREKVQPLVDALIKIANDPHCDRCQIAVNALAKLPEVA